MKNWFILIFTILISIHTLYPTEQKKNTRTFEIKEKSQQAQFIWFLEKQDLSTTSVLLEKFTFVRQKEIVKFNISNNTQVVEKFFKNNKQYKNIYNDVKKSDVQAMMKLLLVAGYKEKSLQKVNKSTYKIDNSTTLYKNVFMDAYQNEITQFIIKTVGNTQAIRNTLLKKAEINDPVLK